MSAKDHTLQGQPKQVAGKGITERDLDSEGAPDGGPGEIGSVLEKVEDRAVDVLDDVKSAMSKTSTKVHRYLSDR